MVKLITGSNPVSITNLKQIVMKLQIESVFIGMCIGLLIGVGLSLLMVKESTEQLKRLQQIEKTN